MVDRAESTAGKQSDSRLESAEIVNERRRERRRKFGLIAGFVLVAAIVITSMILNSTYGR